MAKFCRRLGACGYLRAHESQRGVAVGEQATPSAAGVVRAIIIINVLEASSPFRRWILDGRSEPHTVARCLRRRVRRKQRRPLALFPPQRRETIKSTGC